jgi:hypothetical protein
MTTMVFLIPASLRDAGNTMAEAMGWGAPVFVQPLSSDGKEPVEYWAFPWLNPPENVIGFFAKPNGEFADIARQVKTYTSKGDDLSGYWKSTLSRIKLSVVNLEDADNGN